MVDKIDKPGSSAYEAFTSGIKKAVSMGREIAQSNFVASVKGLASKITDISKPAIETILHRDTTSKKPVETVQESLDRQLDIIELYVFDEVESIQDGVRSVKLVPGGRSVQMMGELFSILREDPTNQRANKLLGVVISHLDLRVHAIDIRGENLTNVYALLTTHKGIIEQAIKLLTPGSDPQHLENLNRIQKYTESKQGACWAQMQAKKSPNHHRDV